MFAVTPIGFVLLSTKLRKVTKVTKLVNFRLELWLDYSTQVSVNSIWEHSDPIMNTCLFRFLCLWLCVCAVQFLKGLLVLFKDVAILFDHLQLIMEVSIKPPVSDISPGSPSHAVAFCVFNQFQGCPAETYLTLQSKWIHSETFKPIQWGFLFLKKLKPV